MKKLVIKNLKKKFGPVWAVKDLNLELDSGEIFVLLGPNGAGKTTTLKLIAGLLHPDEGDVFINGVDIRKNPLEAKSQIGYIPDEPFIYNKLTGREFINFVSGIYGVKHDDYEKKNGSIVRTIWYRCMGRWIFRKLFARHETESRDVSASPP
jgi:ABC-2 type transport system ATP-binding protein